MERDFLAARGMVCPEKGRSSLLRGPFDESVAVILLALCVAAGFKASNPLAERLVLPGILFGLFALGAAKRETARPGVSRADPGKAAWSARPPRSASHPSASWP
jgi:hypothetical protein